MGKGKMHLRKLVFLDCYWTLLIGLMTYLRTSSLQDMKSGVKQIAYGEG